MSEALEKFLTRAGSGAGEVMRAKRAREADLLTLPLHIKGAVCSNCLYVDGDRCKHPKVDQELPQGATRMHCKYWDAMGSEQEYEEI